MTTENLLYTLLGMGVGFAVGFALSVRWVKNGHDDDVVRIGLSNRWQRLFYIGIGVMAVFSVLLTAVKNTDDDRQTQQLADITIQMQQQIARQAYCNDELVRVINANADVSAADRGNWDALLTSIGQQVLNPIPDQGEARRVFMDAFRRYNDTKAANAQARQPYPPPNCGE